MKKTIVWLFSTILLFSTVFIACQKQDDNKVFNKQQNTNNNLVKSTVAADGKDYRIAEDSANTYRAAWYAKNRLAGLKEGEYPVSFIVPRAGLEQLINRAEAQGVHIDKIRFDLVVKDGQVSLVYTGVNPNASAGMDVETNRFGLDLDTYDQTQPCPTCIH